MNERSGPLTGVKVLEFAGLGPGPFAGTFFADLGAQVLRIERPGAPDAAATRSDARGRRAIELDLKDPADVATALALSEKADLLFEGNRPGVMERLGLGPETVLAHNSALVYGRMTGWGQSGPYAHTAGHDINYLALTGALHAIGPEERPIPPLNLAADYGGGAMFLVAGLLAALVHARTTGQGQVVDVGMTDCASYLMSLFYGMRAAGDWADARSANLLDGGAPFYDTYRCADGRFVAIGSIEPQFYALLLKATGTEDQLAGVQMDKTRWPERKEILRAAFARKTRDEWCAIMEGTDICFAPVLSLDEAPKHPHNVARGTFVDVGGVTLPAPAPRFSATPSTAPAAPRPIERDRGDALAAWGV
ncbi:CaiB/BaiF CoA transferase family protein [Flavisphingomonas formosensis]|uniref:CaiB/BaiF CoA transferase family protein n=1 Tax=Flavisphingomonas formosensis TaxID=861534 RepID=UPI0012F7BFBD|nr:CaiB/BaiF CoA-transferase family protein [Sphingomonas formosensis]